ncbi:MAG: hypothetical protein OEZ36_00205 [Spirochaetota bacterium]|nr:hypothetical protein [Spirochaetota bacterium]
MNSSINQDVFIIALIIGFVIGLIISVLFLTTLSNCLKQVHPDHRKMTPGQVWLNLIPLFALGWQFYTVIKIKESLELEYQARKLSNSDNFAYGIGMAWCSLSVASIMPYIGLILAFGSLVLFIIYWVRIAGIKNELLKDNNKYLA